MISFDLYLLDISEEYGNVIKLKVTDDSLVGNPYMFFPPLSNNLRIVAGINGIREAFTAAKMTLNTWTTISVRVAKNGISSVLHWSEKLKKLEIFQNSLNFFFSKFLCHQIVREGPIFLIFGSEYFTVSRHFTTLILAVQSYRDNNYIFEIKVNDEVVLTMPNDKPEIFDDVTLYATAYNTIANAWIRNLIAETTEPKTTKTLTTTSTTTTTTTTTSTTPEPCIHCADGKYCGPYRLENCPFLTH